MQAENRPGSQSVHRQTPAHPLRQLKFHLLCKGFKAYLVIPLSVHPQDYLYITNKIRIVLQIMSSFRLGPLSNFLYLGLVHIKHKTLYWMKEQKRGIQKLTGKLLNFTYLADFTQMQCCQQLFILPENFKGPKYIFLNRNNCSFVFRISKALSKKKLVMKIQLKAISN